MREQSELALYLNFLFFLTHSVTRLDQSSISMDNLPEAQVVILSPRDLA